jgi:hypothetical protein
MDALIKSDGKEKYTGICKVIYGNEKKIMERSVSGWHG